MVYVLSREKFIFFENIFFLFWFFYALIIAQGLVFVKRKIDFFENTFLVGDKGGTTKKAPCH
jgi:hypothetical protein